MWRDGRRAGFRWIALFDNYVAPRPWRQHADNSTGRNSCSRFQINGVSTASSFQSMKGKNHKVSKRKAREVGEKGGDPREGGLRMDARPNQIGLPPKTREGAGLQTLSTRPSAIQTSTDALELQRGILCVYITRSTMAEGHQFEAGENTAPT